MGGPQLGELEAGVVANLWGAAWSVISGGIGCLVATAWVARNTPELREYRRSTPVITHGGASAGPTAPAAAAPRS